MSEGARTLSTAVEDMAVLLKAAVGRHNRLADDYEKLVKSGRILSTNEIGMWKVMLRDATDAMKTLLAAMTQTKKMGYTPEKQKQRQEAA
jgi:hypothetical protein